MNASVKENILFGAAFDQDKYDRVIQATSLSSDLALMPAGKLELDFLDYGRRLIYCLN